MGMFSSAMRFMLMPVLRPLEQTKQSFAQIKSDLDQVRAARQMQNEQRALEREELEKWAADHDASQLPEPYRRFEALYEINKWTAAELAQQHRTVRRTKRVCMFMALVFLIGAISTLFWLPLIALIAVAPMLLISSSVALAASVRFALFQTQIEQRKLCGISDLLVRPDFITYLAWG